MIGNFFFSYCPVLVIILFVVILLAIFRAVRRFLKEGGGAFRVETARKCSEPNKLFLTQCSKALLADADMVCKYKGEFISPTKEDIKVLRSAVKKKYQCMPFLIPNTDQVAYFFCKSEAGFKRRMSNLLPNDKRKSHKWPYNDVETGKKLKYSMFD